MSNVLGGCLGRRLKCIGANCYVQKVTLHYKRQSSIPLAGWERNSPWIKIVTSSSSQSLQNNWNWLQGYFCLLHGNAFLILSQIISKKKKRKKKKSYAVREKGSFTLKDEVQAAASQKARGDKLVKGSLALRQGPIPKWPLWLPISRDRAAVRSPG